jgi:hypothetical protein
MYEVHHLIPDIEAIAMSGRRYVDAISISFPSTIEKFTMDLPLAFVLAVASLLNSVAVQWVLGHGFPDGILPCAFHVVLELIHVNIYSFILGALDGVIHIHWIQGLYNW